MTHRLPASDLTPPEDLAALGEWLDALIAEFERYPDEEVRARVFALLDGVDALHRAALTRLAALLEGPGGGLAWQRAKRDPLVRAVLQLYELLPETEQERAADALCDLRAELERAGGALSVVEARDGVVTVRVSAGHERDAPATVRLIEETLRSELSGFRSLRMESPAPATPTLRLSVVRDVARPAAPAPAPAPAPAWESVATLGELPSGTLRGARADGVALLLCNLGGAVFAYDDACPDTPLLLSLGRLDGEQIVCPWHGCRFDARDGRRLVHRGTGLTPYPVALADGRVRVALNRRGAAPIGGAA